MIKAKKPSSKSSSENLSKPNKELPKASVTKAVQKRQISKDHSSIIPGIDVNELKYSLDVLKYALDYSEAIVDTVKLPLVVLNKKLQVLTANRAFYDTFKTAADVTENQSIYKLNNGAWNIPKLKILLEQILPSNTHFDNYEVEIIFPDIGMRTMLLSARKTYRPINETEAILLAVEDITDRKQLERHKDDFIGIVSHELKNPLTSVKVYIQLLEKYLIDNHDTKGINYVNKVIEQTSRLEQLTASFQNVYRIQTGKLVLKKSKFDLNELLKSIISDFRRSTKAHKIQFKGSGEIIINSDKDRISQVIINLISNAIKYSPQANKVIVTSSEDEKNITVSIRDFGKGISIEEQNKIFDRFYRIKSPDTVDISGLGLGLYLSKEIITQLKGDIRVDSGEGGGSVFTFTLPK